MHRQPVRVLLAATILTLAAALLGPASASAAKKRVPKVPRDWIGVMADGPLTNDPEQRAGEWDMMKRARVGFVRATFYWRDIQPTPDTQRLETIDALMLDAARRGLWVLPVVTGAPVWAAEDPGNISSPPKEPGAYAELLKVLVARYGPDGTLWREHPDVRAQPVRAWQIWNEPNITAYWSIQPFAEAYVALLRASRDALRAADPKAKVVAAGLPNESWKDLAKMYRAGARGTFDAVALHPYTARVSNITRVVRYARKVMRKYGDGGRPVWLTEVTWPASARASGARPGGFEVTNKGQARRLRETFYALARARKKLRIARVSWYTWISAEGKSIPSWSGYAGLRRVRKGGKTVTAPSMKVFKRTVRHLQQRR